jgi:hypothetical protein
MRISVLAFGLALLFVSVTGFAKDADQKSASAARPAPQMAGMGFAALPAAPQHECSQALTTCNSHCNSINGADCEMDCAADCEVCAMDLAQEPSKVCNK